MVYILTFINKPVVHIQESTGYMMLGFQLKARYGVLDSTKSCHSTCQSAKYEEVHGIDLDV